MPFRNETYSTRGESLLMPPLPVVRQSAPTTNDSNFTQGQVWIDFPAQDAYTFIGNVAGTGAVWINSGGGGGLFSSLTVNPGPVTFSGAGAISMGSTAASNFTVTGAGVDLTLSSVGGSAILSSTEASTDAINVTASAGGVDIDGALQVNIASSEDTTDAVAIVSSAGGISLAATGEAGQDIDIVNTGGSVNITATENIADAILITANGGTAETIRVHADQGSTNASIELESDAGGVLVTSAALAATTGLHLAQGAATAALQVGSGAPSHAAPQGSIYMRTDGSSTSTRMYINTDAGTTWTNVTTAA